jgi:hypothetical protein
VRVGLIRKIIMTGRGGSGRGRGASIVLGVSRAASGAELMRVSSSWRTRAHGLFGPTANIRGYSVRA